jgi:hypothetical protein
LWDLIFSGPPKKIREEELESARKSALANSESKNEPKNDDNNAAPPIQPDDEDIDPNEISSVSSNLVANSSTTGKYQVAPELDLENAFDEGEEDDY